MERDEGSRLLFEYRPGRLGPMTVALLLILLLATPFAAIDAGARAGPVGALAACAPLFALLAFAALSAPSPLRIFDDAIEVSRSRASRLLGARTRYTFDEIENVFPSFYEDAAMRWSPFASAEGTAKHAGIRMELRSGERLTAQFTPTRLDLRKQGTQGYHLALAAVREGFARSGRRLVAKPPAYSEEEVHDMLLRAATPLLPFPVTVAGIFAPALLIPALYLAAAAVVRPVPDGLTLALALVGLSPLISVFGFVARRSQTRIELLHEVQKLKEHQREQTTAQSGS